MSIVVKIKLTQDCEAIVDAQDAPMLSLSKWILDKRSDKQAYVYRHGKCKTYLHRAIMRPLKGECVDHINHNGLDNRRDNLRCCSQGQNSANSRKHAATSSQYKGVYWAKELNCWRVASMGCYTCEHLAALAHNQLAAAQWGEFALLNSVDETQVDYRGRVSRGVSPFLGVTKRGGKWCAEARIEGNRKSFGVFKTEIEAARRYNEIARQYGKRLNILPSV